MAVTEGANLSGDPGKGRRLRMVQTLETSVDRRPKGQAQKRESLRQKDKVTARAFASAGVEHAVFKVAIGKMAAFLLR